MAGLPEIDWTVPPDPAEIEQLRELAPMPFSEKLKWLAQAQDLVESLQKNHQEHRARRANAAEKERNLRHE